MYATIRFLNLNKKMIILPGDQLKARFVTDYTDQEAYRLQPDIHASNFPAVLKERYHIGDNVVRLPCDDMKVADSIVCKDYEVHCASPGDRIFFGL